MSDVRTPSRHVLMVDIARRYYTRDQSKVDIAAELGMSRFKVARLLDEARQTGLVRIEISQVGGIDADLSSRLMEELGFAHAVAVHLDPDPDVAHAAFGATAADLLTELVGEDDVLGLPWSRSVAWMVQALQALPPVPVVQLTGALTLAEGGPSRRDDDLSSVDLVRRVAKLTGAPASYFFAPMVAHDAASATAIRRQPSVRTALDEAHRVTIAVVGVGGWGPDTSTLHDTLTARERQQLTRAGIAGEISGVPYDAAGARLVTPVSDKVVALTYDHLRKIQTVVAVAIGREKAVAVRAALAGDLINGLVCDVDLARALLDES